MNKFKGPILIVLILLNSVVLLGQLYPEGVPPFALAVNITTLVLNIIFMITIFAKKN